MFFLVCIIGNVIRRKNDDLNTPVGVSRLDLILANFTCFFFYFNSCLCHREKRFGYQRTKVKLDLNPFYDVSH